MIFSGEHPGYYGHPGVMGEGDMEHYDQEPSEVRGGMGMRAHEMSDLHDDGFDEESNEELNFANNPEFAHLPPLDPWRKSRRDILRSINELREKDDKAELFVDLVGHKVGNAYAEYLLDHRPNEDELKKIMDRYLFVGDGVQCLIGEAYLDFDASNDDKEIPECYMDAHGLLFELEEELKIILSDQYSHVAIGLAFNKQQVKIVELYFRKSIVVHKIAGTENEGVEIQGQMLRNADKKYDVGVYAVRIASLKNLKKDIAITGPPGIQFDQNTKKFTVVFNGPLDVFYSDDEKILELYVRKASPPIPYGEPSDERVNVGFLTVGARMPMVLFPDPRIILEDEADREKEEKHKEEIKRQEEEDRLFKEAQKLENKEEMNQRMQLIQAEAKRDETESVGDSSMVSDKSKKKRDSSKAKSRIAESERSHDDGKSSDAKSVSKEPKSRMSESEEEQEESESDGDESDSGIVKPEEEPEEPADLPSPDEMKRELITAIEEALEERDQLKSKNQELQKEIITMDSTYEQYDKQPDVSMNEHKYLNTLANVHQVRFNLKETQERYNKMATELQAKLNEKQAKCDEIQKQFKDLKRSVAENSVFSRTGKKIKPDLLNEWETRESTKDSEVHHFRFQNIALRNRLANKEKVLKKKEQLADGLHLIDFEQLKIENQTLNEKIEERNEELHKLQKKITIAVITLSHTEEKLKKNTKLDEEHKRVRDSLNKLKDDLNKKKETREKFRKKGQKLRQQTGIENDDSLKADFNNRKLEIEELIRENELLEQHHQRLLQSFKTHNVHM